MFGVTRVFVRVLALVDACRKAVVFRMQDDRLLLLVETKFL